MLCRTDLTTSTGSPPLLHGRLPWYRPDDLDETGRRVYDRVTGGPRGRGPQAFELTGPGGRLVGPFNALLVVPELGEAVQELGARLRFASSLPDRARELAILTVAGARRCSFEWWAHDLVGRQKGLTEDEIAALRERRAADTLDATEAAVHRLVTILADGGDVDDAEHAELVEQLGLETTAEVVTLVGYYELLALSLRFWATPVPEGEADPFADRPDDAA